MTYEIWECLVKDVEKELQKVEKKCKKYNCNFSYKIIDEVTKEVNGENFIFKVIEVNGKAIIDNYQLIAITEVTENGNIIHSLNNEEIPTKFRDSENYCEHCNSKRKRKELFILKNINTNEYKQVGKSCVKLYTNGVSADRYLDIMTCYNLLENFNKKIPSNFKTYSNYKPLVDINDILNVTLMLNEEIGYISTTSYQMGYSDITTKHLVLTFLNNDLNELNNVLERNKIKAIFNEEDLNKDRTKTINDIIEYYLNLEDNSDFIHNVKTLLKNKYINYEMIGYICYIAKGYGKVLEQINYKKQIDDIKNNADFFGEIGKRYKGLEVDNIKRLASYLTDYGMTNIYEIISNSNIFIWKSTKSYTDDFLNKVKTIDITIKNHSEYKGIKQNNVTRCKLIK